jgi:hypothetical protein
MMDRRKGGKLGEIRSNNQMISCRMLYIAVACGLRRLHDLLVHHIMTIGTRVITMKVKQADGTIQGSRLRLTAAYT